MNAKPRLNLFRDYARRRWGRWVGKIILSTGIRCPNRDLGGCIYCSASSFRPAYLQEGDPVAAQLAGGKAYLRTLDTQLFFGCFQQETSTAGNFDALVEQAAIPLRDPDCAGLAISTRPDQVTDAGLCRLRDALQCAPDKPVILELGLQSAREDTLRFLNRNHTLRDFVETAALVKGHPRFELGAHLILGIPGESMSDMRRSVQQVVESGIGHLKLHHLQVVKDTPLSELYQKSPFPLPTFDEYLEILCELIPFIPRPVVIHRLWSTARKDLLCQPRWLINSGQLLGRLLRLLEQKNLAQGQAA
jgi:radical SAM protein (TIGR01212 family)